MTENEDARQLTQFKMTSVTPGWREVYMPQLYLQREEFIRQFKKGKLTEKRAEYYQGLLAGYDAVLMVSENLLKRYAEMEEELAEKKKNLEEVA